MLAQASGKHKAYTHADVSGIGVVETFSELMARTHQEQAGNQACHGIIKSLGSYAHGLFLLGGKAGINGGAKGRRPLAVELSQVEGVAAAVTFFKPIDGCKCVIFLYQQVDGVFLHGLRQASLCRALQALQPRLGVIFIVYIVDGLLQQVLLFFSRHGVVSISVCRCVSAIHNQEAPQPALIDQ